MLSCWRGYGAGSQQRSGPDGCGRAPGNGHRTMMAIQLSTPSLLYGVRQHPYPSHQPLHAPLFPGPRPIACAAKRGSKTASPPTPPRSPPPRPAPSSGSASAAMGPDDDEGEPPDQYLRENVSITQESVPLYALLSEIKNGNVNLEPEYQRDFVWDIKMCMGLIKTVFKGLPMPPVTLYKRHVPGEGIRKDVVDGKQRLVTLYTFLEGNNVKFPRAPTAIELKDDRLSPHLHGKTFQDLSREDRSYMESYVVQVVSIPQETQVETVFDIYEAINQGGKDHSVQQIRRAVYHGPYIRMLTRLAAPTPGSVGAKLQALAALTPVEQSEQEAEELVLRFFAMRRAVIPFSNKRFRTPMKNFLNEELQTVDATGRKVVWVLTPEEQVAMERDFTSAVELLWDLGLKEVAEDAVREPGAKTRSFRRGGGNTTGVQWDVTLVGLSLALDRMKNPLEYRRKKDALQSNYRAMLQSPRWAAIPATLSQKNLQARLELFQEMVIDASKLRLLPAGPRAFSAADKQALFHRAAHHHQNDPTAGPLAGSGATGTVSSSSHGSSSSSSSSSSDSSSHGSSSSSSSGGGRPLCAWCGERVVDMADAEVDHILPYSLGGPTTLDNAQLLHTICNRQRGTKPMSEGPAARAAAVAAAEVAAAAAAAAAAMAEVAEVAGLKVVEQPVVADAVAADANEQIVEVAAAGVAVTAAVTSAADVVSPAVAVVEVTEEAEVEAGDSSGISSLPGGRSSRRAASTTGTSGQGFGGPPSGRR